MSSSNEIAESLAAASPPSSSSPPGGDKAMRRRYKKLRKKATAVLTGPLSGIFTHADWQEFVQARQVLEIPSTATCTSKDDGSNSSTMIGGPQIRWRSVRCEQQPQQAEGASQRDVLFYLLDKSRPTQNHSSSTTNQVEQGRTNENGKRIRQDCLPDGKVPLPAWVTLHNPVGISSVVLLEVHVPTAAVLQSLRQRLASQFSQSHCCLTVPTRWFNNQTPKSIAESLLYAAPPKPPKRSKKQAAAEKITILNDLYQTLKCMALTWEQLTKEGYPMVSSDGTNLPSPTNKDDNPTHIPLDDAHTLIEPFLVTVENNSNTNDSENQKYVASPQIAQDATNGQIYALDCEMVETTAGRALARFTLLRAKDFDAGKKKVNCDIVWDTLVQPDAKVTNYLTAWSGVSAEMLEKGPTVRLAQIQAFLLRQVNPHDILVGHSLENDLLACRYIHRTCVDTAVVFRPPTRNFKYSLRNLTFQLLKRNIQKSDRAHCSEEDAQASLDLAVRRAIEGPSFCVADTRSTNQWATLAKDRTTVAVGPNAWLQKHITSQSSAVHALSCQGIGDDSRKAVMAWIGSKRKADLVWGCFELEKEEDENAFLDYVSEIMKKVPSGDTAVGVALQCQYATSATMFQHRRARQSGKTTLGWTDEEERRFIELSTECQQGSMLWLSSKH